MRITTADFPQADRLSAVGQVAEAVAQRRTSDIEIERFIGLDSAGRQGRYYRRAAEILRLVATSKNTSQLTSEGEAYVGLGTEKEKNDFLSSQLSKNPLFSELVKFIGERQPTEYELAAHVVALYPKEKSTARRRVNSVLSYLRESRLARLANGRYLPGAFVSAGPVTREDVGKGLHGRPVREEPNTGVPLTKTATYTIEIDPAKTERANQVHKSLVFGTGKMLRSRGLPAEENALIDLFSDGPQGLAIFEMKSLTATNFVSQMRRALAQLYEYRYVYQAADAHLCIVASRAPAKSEAFYVEYLEKDRDVAVMWTLDFATFLCSEESSRLLGPFAP
jgi:hypothetical protein